MSDLPTVKRKFGSQIAYSPNPDSTVTRIISLRTFTLLLEPRGGSDASATGSFRSPPPL
jgi:hypothetical protein